MLARPFTETRFYQSVKEEGRKEMIRWMVVEKIPLETIARISRWTIEDIKILENNTRAL